MANTIKVTTLPLLSSGAASPSTVTSPSQLRSSGQPFAQSLARDIETLSQNLNRIHGALSTQAPVVSAALIGSPAAAPAASTPALFFIGPHFQRAARKGPYDAGTGYVETDRRALYFWDRSLLRWQFAGGQGVGPFSARPPDLTGSDAGYQWFASDQSQLYAWTGSSWQAASASQNASGVHGEPLTDGNGNLILANGDVIQVLGVPN